MYFKPGLGVFDWINHKGEVDQVTPLFISESLEHNVFLLCLYFHNVSLSSLVKFNKFTVILMGLVKVIVGNVENQ